MREPRPLPPETSERSAIYVWVEHKVKIGKKTVEKHKWVRYAARDTEKEAMQLATSPLFTRSHATVAVCREIIRRQTATVIEPSESAA